MEINQTTIAWELFKLLYWWNYFKDEPIDTKDVYKILGKTFNVTKEEMNETYENKNKKFAARVRATRFNVFGRNQIIEVVTKGKWQITEYGIEKFQELQKSLNSLIQIQYQLIDY